MKRKTLGVTALAAAAERAGTISSALGLPGGERLVPRDVVRAADGTRHLRFDRTLDGLKAIAPDHALSTKYAAARTGTLAATSDLYGASSPEYAAVNCARAAVNIK